MATRISAESLTEDRFQQRVSQMSARPSPKSIQACPSGPLSAHMVVGWVIQNAARILAFTSSRLPNGRAHLHFGRLRDAILDRPFGPRCSSFPSLAARSRGRRLCPTTRRWPGTRRAVPPRPICPRRAMPRQRRRRWRASLPPWIRLPRIRSLRLPFSTETPTTTTAVLNLDKLLRLLGDSVVGGCSPCPVGLTPVLFGI